MDTNFIFRNASDDFYNGDSCLREVQTEALQYEDLNISHPSRDKYNKQDIVPFSLQVFEIQYPTANEIAYVTEIIQNQCGRCSVWYLKIVTYYLL
jgi:hypothetical protein